MNHKTTWRAEPAAAVVSALRTHSCHGLSAAEARARLNHTANFRDKGVPRRRRLMLAASFFAFVIGSALASYFLLRDASQSFKAAALVFIAGLLIVAAVEDMLEEAHDAQADSRRSVLAFVAGFALFTLVSAGLEEIVRVS